MAHWYQCPLVPGIQVRFESFPQPVDSGLPSAQHVFALPDPYVPFPLSLKQRLDPDLPAELFSFRPGFEGFRL